MNYPIYHFSCGCSWEEGSENILSHHYDPAKKRTSYKRRCKEHPTTSETIEKSCICTNEECNAVFRCSIKANNLLYCKECRPDLAVQRAKAWKKSNPNYGDRYKEDRNEEDKLIEVPMQVVYPEIDRTDLAPCIQGEGCSHKDYDKNNKVCINCPLRAAYMRYNSIEWGNSSYIAGSEFQMSKPSSYRSGKS